jgi:hypothetical protein
MVEEADEEVQCHGQRSAVFMRSVIKADSLPRSLIYTLPIATGARWEKQSARGAGVLEWSAAQPKVSSIIP